MLSYYYYYTTKYRKPKCHDVWSTLLYTEKVSQRIQEAQLSHRGRAMPRVVEYFG